MLLLGSEECRLQPLISTSHLTMAALNRQAASDEKVKFGEGTVSDPGMALGRVLQLLRISGNWWSTCHSVKNSHGFFALFSDS